MGVVIHRQAQDNGTDPAGDKLCDGPATAYRATRCRVGTALITHPPTINFCRLLTAGVPLLMGAPAGGRKGGHN